MDLARKKDGGWKIVVWPFLTQRIVVVFLPAISPLVFSCRLFLVFYNQRGQLEPEGEMAELQQYASDEKPLVFDGKLLHKRAFTRKGKPQPKDAALIAGVFENELDPTVAENIIARMAKVKKAFQGRVEHYVKNWWVENARSLGMKLVESGKEVETYEEMCRELESNPRMENFQNWYNICYKDTEIKSAGKREAESKILKSLKVQYHDKTMVDGCVGVMLAEVMSKQLEYIQTHARNKMCLHLVKSRPVHREGNGRL